MAEGSPIRQQDQKKQDLHRPWTVGEGCSRHVGTSHVLRAAGQRVTSERWCQRRWSDGEQQKVCKGRSRPLPGNSGSCSLL